MTPSKRTAILQPRRVLVHGHRGARGICPENTLEGFRYAIDAGADAIEMDVWATADNILVVSHNPALADGRVIRNFAAVELGPCIPTLDQVLALSSRGQFEFNIEVKSFPKRPRYMPKPEAYAGLLAATMQKRDLAARVQVQSFDFRILKAMARLAPEIRRSALLKLGFSSFVQAARKAVSDTVAPYHRSVTRHRVALAHQAGIRVIPWTANTPKAWARLIKAGVDGIITDDPAGLIRFLEECGLR